jgi:hypothetical protein
MSRIPGNLFVGEEGEAVFTEAFMDFQFPVNELPGFLQRIENTGDDRSFVLVSAVVVERYLDVLLRTFAPGYEALAQKREFNFSLKIELLRSLRLIPIHFTQVADLIRRVRNELAHNIDYDRLEDMRRSLKESMANSVRELYGDDTSNLSSVRAMFKALCFVALAGLQAFRTNLLLLREVLDQGDLVEKLKKECHQRFLSRIEIITSEQPLRVEEKQGWRYSYYRNGVVSIAPSDPENPPTTVNFDLSQTIRPVIKAE